MGHNVFTYGTLQFAEVMHALTESNFETTVGEIHGFNRYCVKDASYPAIVEQSAGRVWGRLYHNVDLDTLHLLDEFETQLYDRVLVEVRLESGERVPGWAYVVPEARWSRIELLPWDSKCFRAARLARYLDECREFRAEYLAGRRSAQS